MNAKSKDYSFQRRPLYPGPPKSNPKYKSKRTPGAGTSGVRAKRDFEVEESKVSSAASIPDSSTSANPFTSDIKDLQRKLAALERQNREKNNKIMKLTRENDSLKARNRVLEGQLNRKKNEEAKNKRGGMGNPRSMAHGARVPHLDKKVSENTNPGDYLTDDRMLELILQSSAQEAALMRAGPPLDNNDQLEQAIQESIREVPNPDAMSYEQLQELGDQIGTVSRGYSKTELLKLGATCNFSHNEECPVCIDKIEIAAMVKRLPCSHLFHAECIDRCLEESKKCPCCGEEVVL
ncbi:unnamed protein product [Moneuplotes crassus]|uniref:RING-type domain-containing protein n=1 Tax=Euplotes crassus TaxID=5936 RepID=A0AAD1UKD0_EUPCR|nr:unnamed protein product [Moneuplotes crassus]